MAVRYEFSYDTPQPNDPQGNAVPPVSTVFSIGGISLDVVKGIRRGLLNVPSITNVVVSRVVESAQAVDNNTT